MTEPGEIVVIKSVAAGIKYNPAGFPYEDEGRGNCSVEKIQQQQHFLLSLY